MNFTGVFVCDSSMKTIGCFYQGWICSALQLSQFQTVRRDNQFKLLSTLPVTKSDFKEGDRVVRVLDL